MMAAGRRSNTSTTACCSLSSSTTPVPNVSTNSPTGSAVPMAYATWTAHVVAPEIADLGLETEGYRLLVNPTGKFVIGGPMGDAGLTTPASGTSVPE